MSWLQFDLDLLNGSTTFGLTWWKSSTAIPRHCHNLSNIWSRSRFLSMLKCSAYHIITHWISSLTTQLHKAIVMKYLVYISSKVTVYDSTCWEWQVIKVWLDLKFEPLEIEVTSIIWWLDLVILRALEMAITWLNHFSSIPYIIMFFILILIPSSQIWHVFVILANPISKSIAFHTSYM